MMEAIEISRVSRPTELEEPLREHFAVRLLGVRIPGAPPVGPGRVGAPSRPAARSCTA